MNVGAPAWRVLACALALACHDDGDAEGGASGSAGNGGWDTGGSAGAPGGSGGAPGGSGGTLETCAFGPPTRRPSTITGSGFDAWNGQTAHGCILEAQSDPVDCDTATIVDGGFSLTAAACGGPGWRVWVGADRTCYASGDIRPDGCHCGHLDSYFPIEPLGANCDAGAP